MKYINILISILILSCSNDKSNSNDTRFVSNIDTLSYSYNGYNNGSKLDLLSDGRFINEIYYYSCYGGGEKKLFFGTYKVDGANLTLKPVSIEFTEYPENRELKLKITKIKYGVDSLKIKTEFKIVKWENNRYLLSDYFDFGWNIEKENDYLRFAEYLNLGLEPRMSGMYLVNKISDSITSEFDLNQIPLAWQSYFLKEPVSAKIKSIKKINNPKDKENISWLIEFDKGERDFINDRLSFQTQDGEYSIEVDSVLEKSSFGTMYMYDFSPKKMPIGTELRTKWE
jgi:hypothetical protein